LRVEFEAAIASDADVVLTLEQAHALTGLSVGHLGREIRRGKIPNAGKRGAPRVRRADIAALIRSDGTDRTLDPAGEPGQGTAAPDPAVRPIDSGGRVDAPRSRGYDLARDGRFLMRSRDGGQS
jgi:hypothetical protein